MVGQYYIEPVLKGNRNYLLVDVPVNRTKIFFEGLDPQFLCGFFGGVPNGGDVAAARLLDFPLLDYLLPLLGYLLLDHLLRDFLLGLIGPEEGNYDVLVYSQPQELRDRVRPPVDDYRRYSRSNRDKKRE